MAWKVAAHHADATSGSVFQNYMGPLRLVLSPADMAAVFINLEVSPCAPLPPVGSVPGPGLRCVPARGSVGPG